MRTFLDKVIDPIASHFFYYLGKINHIVNNNYVVKTKIQNDKLNIYNKNIYDRTYPYLPRL